jgi:hypothetical protein
MVPAQKEIETNDIRSESRPGKVNFTSRTNPASRINFGQQLRHLAAVMWWNMAVLESNGQMRVEGETFNSLLQCIQRQMW